MKLYFDRMLILFLAMAGLCSAQANGPARASYRFEAEPRAVLAPSKITTSRDPKLYVSSSGDLSLLAVYGGHGDSRLAVFSSHDGGDSFSMPELMTPSGVTSHGENSPTFAFAWPYVVAVWEQKTPEGGSDIMFARRHQLKNLTDKPVRITDKAKRSPNSFPFMTASPSGTIYAVWLDGRDEAPAPADTYSIYLARSTDGGTTFGKNIRVATAACPCCRPTIGFGSKGEVLVAFRKVFDDNIRDIAVAASTDDGTTFGAPVRVALDNWKLNGCPHTGPAFARKNNRLFLTWYSEGQDKPGIRLAWSDDGAKSFSPAVIASGNIVDSNHPQLSVSEDGRMVLVFQGRDPVSKEGWGAVRPYLAEVDDSGKVSQAVMIPGSKRSISSPAVVAGTAGRVFVAWTEPGENGSQVMLSRGRRTLP